MEKWRRSGGRRLILPGAVLIAAALLGGTLLLQTVWSHRTPRFTPEYEKLALEPILAQAQLSPEQYELLYLQTGLSGSAVDALRRQGEEGVRTILAAQEGFFRPQEPQCVPLVGGRITCEDVLRDEAGEPICAVPLCPLQPGDILLTFATHSLGWRHGHAGLVTDPGRAVTLEAIRLGIDSCLTYARHWTGYANFMVLRVRDAAVEEGRRVVEFAKQHLKGAPYSLFAGLGGSKAQYGAEELSVQCAYLPWRAWLEAGYDLDSTGGELVTPADLARSPALEVVQVYGMDPELFADRLSAA